MTNFDFSKYDWRRRRLGDGGSGVYQQGLLYSVLYNYTELVSAYGKKTSPASGALNLQKFDLRQLALITVSIVALMFFKGLPLSN